MKTNEVNTQARNLLETYENIREQLFALGDACFYEYENIDADEYDARIFSDASDILFNLEDEFVAAIREKS